MTESDGPAMPGDASYASATWKDVSAYIAERARAERWPQSTGAPAATDAAPASSGWKSVRRLLGSSGRADQREAALLAAPSRPMRYVLTRDANDDEFVILFDVDPASRAAVATALEAPAVGVVPVSGSCSVHGDVRDGAELVVVVDGRSLRSDGEAFAIIDDRLAFLVDPAYAIAAATADDD